PPQEAPRRSETFWPPASSKPLLDGPSVVGPVRHLSLTVLVPYLREVPRCSPMLRRSRPPGNWTRGSGGSPWSSRAIAGETPLRARAECHTHDDDTLGQQQGSTASLGNRRILP